MFSDKYAAESVEYGVGTVLITAVLAAIFVFVGVFVGNYALFGADYSNAHEFREFVYDAVIDGDVGIRTYADGAVVTVGGEKAKINTFADGSAKTDYGFIVDHNNVSAYDDFTAYCKNTDGGEDISYESFLELSDDLKRQYTFSVEYSGNVKTVDDRLAESCRQYLLTVSAASSELKELEESKASVSPDRYRDSMYELYVSYYYPDMRAASGEDVPTLRGYYYYNYIYPSDGKYLCIFGDMVTGSFVTGTGKRVDFGMSYGKDGLEFNDGESRAQKESKVDDFIKNGYYDGLTALFFSDFMMSFLTLLLTEMTIALTMGMCWLICRSCKIEIGGAFADSARIIGSYAHWPALFAGAIAAATGFFVDGAAVIIVSAVAYFVIIAVRTAPFLVRQYKISRRNEEESA